MKHSIIYDNLNIYRLVITLLYGGKYKERFYKVCGLLKSNEKNVLELCFGDTVVAEYCQKNDKNWTGIDITENFVSHAQKLGFRAQKGNISQMDQFPPSDVCLMVGSLYHFEDHLGKVLSLMLDSTQRIIISEPINNVSSRKDVIGRIARTMAAVKGNPAEFRYTKESFLGQLDILKDKIGFHYAILDEDKRDIILEIKK